jgi:hypothetical protein
LSKYKSKIVEEGVYIEPEDGVNMAAVKFTPSVTDH